MNAHYSTIKPSVNIDHNIITLFLNRISDLSNSVVDWVFGRIYMRIKI